MLDTDSSPNWGLSRFGCVEAVWGLGSVEGGVGVKQASGAFLELGRLGLQAGVPRPGFSMWVFHASLATVLTLFSPSPVGLFN